MTPILRARKLTGPFDAVPAFTGIDLELESGECVGISAAHPDARTALLRALATLVPPSSGMLEIDGIDAVVRLHDARRRVMYAGTPIASGRGLLVREYLRFCHDARMGHRPAPDAVEGALALTGLRADATVESLTAPFSRTLLLAVALLCRPRVVVVDGGTADDEQDDPLRLSAAIDEMRRREMAVVVSVDGNGAVRSACQRVLRLESGRLASEHGEAPQPVAAQWATAGST